MYNEFASLAHRAGLHYDNGGALFPKGFHVRALLIGYGNEGAWRLEQEDGDGGEVTWTSELFSVNATNSSHVYLDSSNLSLTEYGHFELFYQKRVIDSSQWVNESIPAELIEISDDEDSGLLPFSSPIWAILAIGLAGIRKNKTDTESNPKLTSKHLPKCSYL